MDASKREDYTILETYPFSRILHATIASGALISVFTIIVNYSYQIPGFDLKRMSSLKHLP